MEMLRWYNMGAEAVETTLVTTHCSFHTTATVTATASWTGAKPTLICANANDASATCGNATRVNPSDANASGVMENWSS
jgi:hypothetical protein